MRAKFRVRTVRRTSALGTRRLPRQPASFSRTTNTNKDYISHVVAAVVASELNDGVVEKKKQFAERACYWLSNKAVGQVGRLAGAPALATTVAGAKIDSNVTLASVMMPFVQIPSDNFHIGSFALPRLSVTSPLNASTINIAPSTAVVRDCHSGEPLAAEIPPG